MDYKFIKKGIDDYELHFKDKNGKEVVKPFKNTIKEAQMLDSINLRARIKLMDTLKSMGKVKDDFTDKYVKDGKTIVDESRYLELENTAIEEESTQIIQKCVETAFNEDFNDLLEELGINVLTDMNDPQKSQDLANFVAKFTAILTGKDEASPSGEVYYKGEIKS